MHRYYYLILFLTLNLKNDIENYVVTIDSGEYISLVYKYLINRNPKFKSKTEVIYNGIEKFREDFEKKKREKFTIGNIGRLTYQKGQEYLI